MRFRTTSGLDLAVDPIQMKNVTFEHVKGVEEAKNELQDVVEFLKNPQKFTVLGGKLPKGGDLFLTLPVFNREFSSLFFLLVIFPISFRNPPGGSSRNREDPIGTGCGRRGRRAVLLRLRVRVR